VAELVLESSVEIVGVEFDGSGVEVGFGSDGGMGSCGGGFGGGLHLAMVLALSGGVSIGPGAFAVPSLVIGDIGVEQLVPSHSNLYFNCACVLHRCTH